MAEEQQVAHVSSDSRVAIPLQNLVSILGATAIVTWGYFGITERLTKIERDLSVHWEEIEENDQWIEEFQPPPQVRETVIKVRDLEQRLLIIETERRMQGK